MFTEDEVSAAVDRFLLTQVGVPTLSTGARDVLTLRSQIYDLLTTALLLRPDSYFYIIYLGRNRLMALVSQQIASIDKIITAGSGSSRPAKLIKSTTDLAAAQAAILDLNAGLNVRSNGVRGSIGPAVDRFRRSVSSFVTSELTKNVVVGGVITETGAGLRRELAEDWAEAVDRHPKLVQLAGNIASAMSNLSAVQLPQSSVRDIVSRIQSRLAEVRGALESPSAIADSRSSMLELLTMRTLLTKASSFRNPELVLMPKVRDATTLAFVDSAGAQASIVGTISGPFNYNSATLNLSVNSGTPVTITLPGSSRAELRSATLSPWVVPTPGDQAAFAVDFGATATAIIAAYADGPAAAVALNAALTTMQVTWDAGTSQLVFRSLSAQDASNLQLLIDTAQRQGFRAWAFPAAAVAFISNKGMPVPLSKVIAATASGLVSASAVATVLTSFVGARTGVGGEEAILWDILDASNDLVSGTGVSSPSRNFGSLGVTAGMILHTTAPAVADYEITSVTGSVLVLDPVPPPGTLTYYIGPDYRGIADGSRVQVSGIGDNTGFYRVAVGGGQAGRILVDRNLQSVDDALSVSVFTEFVKLEALGMTTSSSLGVLVSSLGATALGLSVELAETTAQLTRMQITGAGDFLLRGVRPGDLLTLTSPTSVVYETTIESVLTGDLYIASGVVFEAGNWTYKIRSAKAAQFGPLEAGASQFLITEFVTNFAKLDTLVGRLIRGAVYTGEITAGIVAYRATLSSLLSVLGAYTMARERTIDNIVQTLREQGLDRALDLLLALEIEELLTMEPDGVSYSTWLVRASATVAREVLPVSKFSRSPVVMQEWRTVSGQPNAWEPNPDENG